MASPTPPLTLEQHLSIPSSLLPAHLESLAIPSSYLLSSPSTIPQISQSLNSLFYSPQYISLTNPLVPFTSLTSLNLAQNPSSSSSNSTSSSTTCGHVFKSGESVYRCRTCGVDSTCVLCAQCFFASPEHRGKGHDVTMSVHSGVGAGCCDCGDEEAWKAGKQTECGIHSTSKAKKGKGKERASEEGEDGEGEEDQELIRELKEKVEELVRVLLGWSVEQFEKSPRDLIVPKKTEDFTTSKNKTPLAQPQPQSQVPRTVLLNDTESNAPRLQPATIPPPSTSTFLSFPWSSTTTSQPSPPTTTQVPGSYPISSPPESSPSTGPFSILLWNDEKHSFPQVIDIVSLSIGCSRRTSSLVAQTVDTVGRSTILVSSDAEECLKVVKLISSIELGCEVRDSRELFCEEVAGRVIDWVKGLMGLRIGGERGGLREVVAKVWLEVATERGSSLFERLARVEERLWKECRKGIQEINVGLLSVSYEIKQRLSIQYASIYPSLCSSYLLTDREPENSLLFLSVQIFTVPSICLILTSPPHHLISQILSILFSFFTEQTFPPRGPLPSSSSSSIDHEDPLTKPRRIVLPPNRNVRFIDPESSPSFKQKRYFQIFSDLSHLVSSPSVQAQIREDHKLLREVCDFLELFEGMNELVRAEGSHVEYENDSWVSSFNLTIQLSKLARNFGRAYHEAVEDRGNGLGIVMKCMKERIERRGKGTGKDKMKWVGLGGKGEKWRVVEFDVKRMKNSFHHPLIWLWSEMGKNVQRGSREELSKLCLLREDGNDEGEEEEAFLKVMDSPLRVIVLVAQIRAGLWVRNGFGVRAQQLHYKEYSLRENTYDQDLFFLQNSLVVLEPSIVLASIVDRFDLRNWLILGRDQDQNQDREDYEPSQAMAMTEELLSLLITLVSDPTYTLPLSSHEAFKRELVHHLALGSCVYSELLRRISERFGEDGQEMDRILEEISTFKPPTGTNDQGVYSLREEFYGEVDPYFARYSRNQRELVEGIVKEHLGGKNGEGEKGAKEEYVIVPKSLEIGKGTFEGFAGKVLDSEVLRQTIYWSLKSGRKRGELFSEVVVDQALHLAMLSIGDGESRDGFIQFAKSPAPMEVAEEEGEEKEVGMNEDDLEEREADEYVPKSSISTTLNAQIEEDESTFIRLLIKVEEDERMKTVRGKCGWLLDRLQEVLGEREVGQYRKKFKETSVKEEEETKKKNEDKKLAAKRRQEEIMKKFQQAQSAFLESVEDDDDDDDEEFEDEDDEFRMEEEEENDNQQKKPTRVDFGSCIVCQDQLEDSKAFGILGLIQGSNLVRLSPTGTSNVPFQRELLSTPSSLDHDASSIRPFGVASNKIPIHSFDQSGDGISLGFPQNQKSGFHASSCGHLMHLECFETYCSSISTRHRQQPTRCHPETIERREFVCPLCKSLGNVLLPTTTDDPAFQPYRGGLARASLAEWAALVEGRDDESARIRADQLQVVNDLDHSIFFKPWRISLALPTLRPQDFEDREGLMIARLLQVVTALKSEIGGSTPGVAMFPKDVIGYTVASMEIASRGTSDPVWKLTDSNLRLLQSMFSVTLELVSSVSLNIEPSQVALIAIKQRLGGIFARGTKLSEIEFTQFDPLSTVIEAAACCPPVFYYVVTVSFYTFLAQSYLGIYRLFHQSSSLAEWKGDSESPEARLFLSLVGVRQFFSSAALFNPDSNPFDLTLGKHLHSQLLPFLRRSAIVARATFGEPDPTIVTFNEGLEFDRLLSLLRIPSPSIVLSPSPSSSDPNSSLLREHLSICAASATYLQSTDLLSSVDSLINHPSTSLELEHSSVLYELLGLPHHLDTLIASTLERKCARCEQSPENPALCLLCGELVCCQSFCCMAGEEESQHGECNEHMWTCGGSIGIYFLVKRNVILYLHTDKGAFLPTPYLDSHGEVDNGRTRTRSQFPQYLHKGRYDEIRKVWLNQGVATLVARKLEASTDHGGWTTM